MGLGRRGWNSIQTGVVYPDYSEAAMTGPLDRISGSGELNNFFEGRDARASFNQHISHYLVREDGPHASPDTTLPQAAFDRQPFKLSACRHAGVS